jgi:RNA polymerase sigma-70 factor (ECF subfamily)
LADDREVWSRILQQDEAAFNAFYQEHSSRLHAFLRALVGDRQAAEDLAQETFLQLWTRPSGYQLERGPLRTYLFGIARKRAAEWWRQQQITEPLPQERNGWCGTETNALILNALHTLVEEQRTLLWLREIEGQSYAELALILDIPLGTVRSRLFAAREALKRIWQTEHAAAETRKV